MCVHDVWHAVAGLNGPRALQQTISTCLGTDESVWFNSTLVFPDCEAFTVKLMPDVSFGYAPEPAPALGDAAGGMGYAVMTTGVQGGCGTQLPILCLGPPS